MIWNQTVTLGCVPLSPAIMQDFQDFVSFLAGGQPLPPPEAGTRIASMSMGWTRRMMHSFCCFVRGSV